MPIIKINDFTKKVLQNIKNIPKGKVATYKQIAELSGKPQGSRGVSWILHSCSTTYKLPWHRVLNSQGKISFDLQTHNYRKQKKLLESEGIVFNTDGKLDFKIFKWSRKPSKTKNTAKNKKQPKMFTK